ncbi:MAG: type II secretion system minor pseudopilin GspK [Gammaproteobacteria bacterium]|nr:MAG: type II secretion system minor pseudopilin GspK [Gammaproteobacteria bacterium]
MVVPVAGLSVQRGVALVTALLVVSVVTVVAVAMATRQHIDVRRTGNLIHGEQAYDYALAAESWARVVLRRDAEDSDYDSLEEDWATALPPIAVEGGLVDGAVEDLQGRFNLNNLANVQGQGEGEGEGAGPGADQGADIAYYKRLLDTLGLEAALADTLVDWIDADINVRFPNGAEDEYYLLLERPYRTANRMLVSVSELRLVKDYDQRAIELLLPHVTALPTETSINVNTATPIVLQALNAELSESDVSSLIADRGENGYKNINDFLSHDALAGLAIDTDIDVNSAYFRVLTDVVIGQSRVQLESLLERESKTTRIVYRNRNRALQAQVEASTAVPDS